MRAALIAVGAAALCAPSMLAVDRDFRDIVRMMSDELHAKPTRIPLFGLVNTVAFVARPAGVKHLDLAVFENIDGHSLASDLRSKMDRVVGRGWKPFVQVMSQRAGREMVLVYMKPEGRNCQLLVTTLERNEATVIQLNLNPDGLQKWIADPARAALHVGDNHGRDRDEEP
jgi:hypothetical protein